MDDKNTMKLSIVLSIQQTGFEAVAFDGDYEQNFSRIADLGYDGVELAIRDPDLINLDQLISYLVRCKLKVPAIGTGQAWGEEHISFASSDPNVRDVAVKRIKRHIELATHLDALVIIGLIRGVTPTGQTKEQSLRFVEDCLIDCLKAASEKGVFLVIEPINRYETDLVQNVAEALDLLDRIGSPHLRLLLDTFHMNIEEPDILASIRCAGEHIRHVHVADSNRWYPGAGHLDFKKILAALGSTGYTGWISGEFMPLPDPNIAALKNIQYLESVFSISSSRSDHQ
jgi:sugar phosphate isomerase/epimerase